LFERAYVIILLRSPPCGCVTVGGRNM